MEEKDIKINEEELTEAKGKDDCELSDVETQFYDMVRDFLCVPIDTTNLLDKTINTKLFVKGINDVSEYCGQYIALKNVGMDEDTIAGVILSKMNNEYQYKINRANIEGQQSIQKSINKTSEKIHDKVSLDDQDL